MKVYLCECELEGCRSNESVAAREVGLDAAD